LSESVEALAGARIPAECGRRSRTQQISRKRSYKTLDLRGHKSIMAITPPERPFFVITRKKVTCSANLPATPVPCWLLDAEEFSKSFGGRLAQIRAIRARTPTRRAWSSTEEFAFVLRGSVAPLQAQSGKRVPSPHAVFAWGEGGGSGVSPKASGLLHLTEVLD
jgi:hypothetical protein